MRLSVLIPVYCEAETIAPLLEQVRAVDFAAFGVEAELIVVNDGSTDGTAARLAELGAGLPELRVLTHPKNAGKGASVRSALARATGEYVLIQDADLEYSVGDYPAFLRAMRAGQSAVYGSRFLARAWPSGMRPAHFAANKLLTWTANLLYGHALTDQATCFKLVRTELLRAMALESRRFELCPEITAKLGLMGVPIAEVPVAYQARSITSGKKVRFQDGLHALWELLRHRLRARRAAEVEGHARSPLAR